MNNSVSWLYIFKLTLLKYPLEIMITAVIIGVIIKIMFRKSAPNYPVDHSGGEYSKTFMRDYENSKHDNDDHYNH